MDAVRLLWLPDGGLPIFPFQGLLHYMAGGSDDKEDDRLRWRLADFTRYSSSAIIPIIDTTLRQFLMFMQEPHVVEGETLYVAVRSFARLEAPTLTLGPDDLPEGRTTIDMLLVAAAIVPGVIEEAVPWPWRYEPLSTLSRLCTIGEATSEPVEPFLKAAYHQLAQSREYHCRHERARDKARQLLESFLNEEQLDEFKKKHRFRVRGPDGLVYLITYESHANVWQIDTAGDGRLIPRTNYCIIATDAEIPIYDLMLAQKLMIEGNFEDFKRIANSARYDDEGHRIREAG